MKYVIAVNLTEDDVAQLARLVDASKPLGPETVPELVEWLAVHAAEGARRPGSWERGWVEQCTGARFNDTVRF